MNLLWAPCGVFHHFSFVSAVPMYSCLISSMASSYSNTSPWKPFLFLLSLLLSVSDATDSLPFINATSVDVGFLWEHPRQENHHSTRVIIADNHLKSVLSLICFISPPLPHTPEYEDKKNELVRWEKITTRGAEAVNNVRYWASDRTTVAIKYDNITSDVIGSYTCSYGQLSKLINVNVANVDIVKALKMPTMYEEVKNYATHMEDTTGIAGWNNDKSLSQSKGSSLSCKHAAVIKSKDSPATIHTVRPADITVIAAVGDGFTTGLGARATSWNGFFTEYRETSWSIGGEGHLNQTTTLPNIFREFNPGLKGYSTQAMNSLELNMATSFSSSWDLEKQVNQLITTMQSNKEIDFKNDWKVLTISTGVTDLCHICKDPDRFSGSHYIKNVMHSLNILKNKVPRLYVNLVPPMDVSVLYGLYDKNPSCHIMQWSACPCAARQDKAANNVVSKAAKKFTSLLEELVNSGIYDLTDQFTVVIQPFMKGGPKDKTGGLASRVFGPDCLHFNTEGHAAAAIALWNNMMEPLHDKNTIWNTEQTPKCPMNGQQYLSTKVNSNVVTTFDSEDDTSTDIPPAAAITLSVFLIAVVLSITFYVWRSRKSRPYTDTMRLLEFPYKPRL
ncbi:phospholipase B1, membrane-associated-like [Actinia tenebrosa]|uniref:Phospholipase B1, membrane-associated n=1 Tax=Actinia tenebrosa TaxID=6105 RepID=A0A6P8I9Z5_ACTTE|nr:phospholipase B1, membrane-associated-like [Actinia tenebrosa]